MPQVKLTEDQQNALEIKKHVTLTANAGSGKTFVLTQRFLEILLKTNTSLKQIAAITFTDKAAGELYGKISRSILDASLKAGNERDRLKYEQLRKQLVSANISTIHSFCAQILREFPVEADIDANFSPIDASLAKELINLSLNEAIKSFEKSDEKNILLQQLVRIFGSIRSLAAQLEHAIYHRSTVKDLSRNIYSKDSNSIAEFFTSQLENYISQIFLLHLDSIVFSIKRINAFALQRNSSFAEIISELLRQLETKPDALKTFRILLQLKENIVTKSLTIKKDGYLGRKLPAEFLNDISTVEQYFNSLANFENFSEDENLHKQLASFGRKFLLLFNAVFDIYENKKYELGYLDFEDILIKTKIVLELPEVRQKLSQKYRYLMVDEYQDTNEIQYEIFLPILERLKAGNLFVVGDEKQSIYKFRDAELSVFSKTKNDVSNEEGLTLALPASFRMSPVLCAFTNHLFQNLFADANPLFNEVVHADLISAKNDELNGSIEILLANNNKEEKIDSEADLVAKKILSLIENENAKINLSDIAILCRKRSSFETLEMTFQKCDLPYIIWEGKGFYQQQIIFDFYNYITFLSNPSDDTALIGVLRSPFFFLSDTDILTVSLQHGFNFWDKLNTSAKNNPHISSIVSFLLKHKNFLQSSDLVTLLRIISEETNYLSIVASRKQGKKALANFEKLIQLTRNFFKQGFRNVFDYLKYLNEAIADSTEEGQAQVSSDEEAVKIMTVHQAKGLEFKAVFIFECHKEGVDAKIKAKEIQINKEFGLMAKLPAENNFSGKYLTSPIVDLHNFLETKKELAELKRLLYVAITRAKNYLYFSATVKHDTKFPQTSFINLLSLGLHSDFTNSQISKEVDLVYLLQQNNQEIKISKPTEFIINILKNIPGEYFFKRSDDLISNKYDINLSKIVDVQKEEIISATKVAIYNQCPTKYLLTYEFGYNELYDSYKKYLNKLPEENTYFEFGESEFDESLRDEIKTSTHAKHVFPAELKGKLIHTILEKNLPLEEVTPFIQKYFMTQKTHYLLNELISFQEIILHELTIFYSSEIYRTLQREENFQNEFQVYLKEKDFYLFGIIDKVIFAENAVTIIDYKTDNVKIEELHNRAQDYFLQLTFYAFILKKLFPEKDKILLQIIFIKFPDEKYIHQIEKDELLRLETLVNVMVSKIREKNFSKNLNHCGQCHFADSRNNCIF
ncbi:MAG: UvrD-helicase domain-containing protein [Ignavibacteriaceae bacterium]|nr:UvrD-helicase domain-containing protein [Ignavibacteriaceae bacterium]